MSVSRRPPAEDDLSAKVNNSFLLETVQPTYGKTYDAAWCIHAAQRLFSANTVVPLKLEEQGCFSYSVIVDKGWIAQFRLPAVDPPGHALLIKQAHDLLPEWVPDVDIVDCPPFSVWRMRRLPGVNFLTYSATVQHEDVGILCRIEVVATLLARTTTISIPTTSNIITALDQQLSKITHPRFFLLVKEVRASLHTLCSLPTTITHMDLTPLNMLVNPDTGAITGIVDWADSVTLPFGAGLYALDLLLGRQDMRGWHWREDKPLLEEVFWSIFWSRAHESLSARRDDPETIAAIRLAKDVGILLKYVIGLRPLVPMFLVEAFLCMS